MVIKILHSLIEVAYFISSFLDVAGTGEEKQKGSAPKGYGCCDHISWA